MTTKLKDYHGDDQNSLFGIEIPQDDEPYIPQSESFPGLPEWLNKSVLINTSEFRNMQSKFILADINSHFAYEIAIDFETGKFPGGVSHIEAYDWFTHASALGSAEAAIRLYHIDDNPSFLKVGLVNVTRGLDTISSGQKVNQHFDLAAFAASKLLELDLADENVANLIEQNIRHRKFKTLTPEVSKQFNQLLIDLSGLPSHEIGHTVIKQSIADENDFKIGIYKNLMSRLQLAKLNTDPTHILKTLNAEFPWFHQANIQVYKQLQVRLQSTQPAFKLRPMLLVGPPGVGKTTWANRLAELVGVPSSVIMAAGSAESMHLKGLARGWGSARPGALARLIAIEKIANPLMVVDEIDKASEDNRNGSIWNVLLQLVEPSTSKNYLDECLQVPCDFSWVSWIATCNTLGGLPKPLLDRFTVVLIEKPGPEYSQSIINGAIRAYAKELGMDHRMLPMLDGDNIEMLVTLSPREINRVVRMMMEDQLTKNKRSAMH